MWRQKVMNTIELQCLVCFLCATALFVMGWFWGGEERRFVREVEGGRVEVRRVSLRGRRFALGCVWLLAGLAAFLLAGNVRDEQAVSESMQRDSLMALRRARGDSALARVLEGPALSSEFLEWRQRLEEE